ncbi:hypothetical protein QBC41DRAFT_398915 [Cercophora samala]|uniref:Uncharacterized protein n=1 Tax=Cercophora samala TaxID=330535 RepID=A0AA39Z9Q6_9PEZI|nr:hypothetical protein QBC41DRAFT_398915 [Cercophora samala]
MTEPTKKPPLIQCRQCRPLSPDRVQKCQHLIDEANRVLDNPGWALQNMYNQFYRENPLTSEWSGPFPLVKRADGCTGSNNNKNKNNGNGGEEEDVNDGSGDNDDDDDARSQRTLVDHGLATTVLQVEKEKENEKEGETEENKEEKETESEKQAHKEKGTEKENETGKNKRDEEGNNKTGNENETQKEKEVTKQKTIVPSNNNNNNNDDDIQTCKLIIEEALQCLDNLQALAVAFAEFCERDHMRRTTSRQ